MTALFLRNFGESDLSPQIEPLLSSDVRYLRLPWLSRFTALQLADFLRANPGLALWVPKTGEYAVAEKWRHRDDIASILEVTARKGREALVTALVERAGKAGHKLVLCSDDVWRDHTKSRQQLGFAPLEKIVFFQRDLRDKLAGEPRTPLPHLDYKRLGGSDMELLLQLDHDSFPWLWWNSAQEFEVYATMDNVYIYGAFVKNMPVGYASYTMYEGWAHLDRLAVISSEQGKRYGASQLYDTLRELAARNAASVALSTQENNAQSHRLYRAFGFSRLSETMTFYGKYLPEPGSRL